MGYPRLKAYMKLKNITQPELATKLNMALSTLNAKINGNSDFTGTEMKEVSQVLGISVNEIFFTDTIHEMKSDSE
ncbi:MAG: helix-turn-helix transcriptional regulator [Clostridiaceae bacterium]